MKIADRVTVDSHKLSKYGLIAPDGTWYSCEFGEHAALAGRIIMQNKVHLNLSDKEALDMAFDWSGKGLDYLYQRGWIAVRNPYLGKTFLDMDATKTATQAQVNNPRIKSRACSGKSAL